MERTTVSVELTSIVDDTEQKKKKDAKLCYWMRRLGADDQRLARILREHGILTGIYSFLKDFMILDKNSTKSTEVPWNVKALIQLPRWGTRDGLRPHWTDVKQMCCIHFLNVFRSPRIEANRSTFYANESNKRNKPCFRWYHLWKSFWMREAEDSDDMEHND